MVGGTPIDPARRYRLAINDFLLNRLLTPGNPDVTKLADHVDVRKALIAELQR